MEDVVKCLTSEPTAFLAFIAGVIAITAFVVKTRNRTDDNSERLDRVENDIREAKRYLKKMAADMAEMKSDIRNIFSLLLQCRQNGDGLSDKNR